MSLNKKASNFLQPIHEVTCSAQESVDVHALYKDNTALYVGDGFNYRILSEVKKATSLGAKITGFHLAKSLTPMEVRFMLPDSHVFENTGAFCIQLAGMVTKQSEGQEGALASSGRANIFYVRGATGQMFVVECLWDTSRSRWFLQAYQLSDFSWDSGCRVFSNATF